MLPRSFVGWDRSVASAFVLASISLAISALLGDNARRICVHVMCLGFPLTVIAWPDMIEALFRVSRSGFVHGGEGPTPGVLIRVAAWLLFVVIVVVHHLAR